MWMCEFNTASSAQPSPLSTAAAILDCAQHHPIVVAVAERNHPFGVEPLPDLLLLDVVARILAICTASQFLRAPHRRCQTNPR
jgi:hypothetical protein